MTHTDCWNLFLETGEPMYYLLYKEALETEKTGEKTA